MGLMPDWALNDMDILIAIYYEDTAALKIAIKSNKETLINWGETWKFAYTCLKWDAMDALLQAPKANPPNCLYETLFWLVEHHRWDELQAFLDFTRRLGVYSAKAPYLDTSSLERCQSATYDCIKLIRKGSFHDLEVYLDIVRQLGGCFPTFPFANYEPAQMAILSAIASGKLPILKLLADRHVISFVGAVIGSSSYVELKHISPSDSPLNHFMSSGSRMPLDLAIAFVLDLEIVEYLSRTGARWENNWKDTGVDEPETLRNLCLTTSVADAQKQNWYMKDICSKLCFEKANSADYMGQEITSKIWMMVERSISEGDSPRPYGPTDENLGSTWPRAQSMIYPTHLNTSAEKVASWPTPLLTQENWDNWRLRVIDILEKL
ncbi:hypothetical protein GGI35DRAFT_170976 [Trichoderma velutinum]